MMQYASPYFGSLEPYSTQAVASAAALLQVEEAARKRKQMSGDEKKQQNRERNRMHARKTRERKKQQTLALQARIRDLQQESDRLKQVVDERYTASALLGLNQTTAVSGELVQMQTSSCLCDSTACKDAMAEYMWLGDQGQMKEGGSQKRVRRRGKYSPQERERIRRERNRMHAKKTRDRKKMLVEASELAIHEMELEVEKLRNYLRSLNLISEEEFEQALDRDAAARKELADLKASSSEVFREDGLDGEADSVTIDGANPRKRAAISRSEKADANVKDGSAYDGEEEYEQDTLGDDEQENDMSVCTATTDSDNEKNSWTGSNGSNGSTSGSNGGSSGSRVSGASSNRDSATGNTSGDSGSGISTHYNGSAASGSRGHNQRVDVHAIPSTKLHGPVKAAGLETDMNNLRDGEPMSAIGSGGDDGSRNVSCPVISHCRSRDDYGLKRQGAETGDAGDADEDRAESRSSKSDLTRGESSASSDDGDEPAGDGMPAPTSSPERDNSSKSNSHTLGEASEASCDLNKPLTMQSIILHQQMFRTEKTRVRAAEARSEDLSSYASIKTQEN